MLLDKMARVIVGIFIALAMSHLVHQASYRVTQMQRHWLVPAMLYIFLNPRISLVQRVAFGSSCQIDHCFS